PATGTGTFLYGVVNQIYKNIEEIGLVTSWNDYVKNNLLPRLYGFELLMAPYAIAHLKLGWQLQELGYQFQQKQRLGIYLTNTLDEALKKSDMLFGQFVAQEANDASEIKQNVPVMVVLGNPPYSGHSANKGEWIETLVQDYYQVDGVPLGERNSKYLQDDYVKFIRFGQWRINETGYGVLAFITNHGYLDNPTFCGMRQHLMQTFTEIYVLDLHGNSRKKEVCPDGSPDKNVFDIQTGVCIGIFIKEPGKETPAKVYHADLWGDQWHKYYALNRLDIETTEWTRVEPNSPFYLFYPQAQYLLSEYNKGWKITDIMPVNSTGVKTHRDHFVLDFERAALQHRIEEFRNLEISDQQITETYQLQDSQDWEISPNRRSLASNINWETYLTECLYRPFDLRAYYHKEELVDRPRKEIMDHLQGFENLALLTMRRIREADNNHFFVSRQIVNKDAVSITDNCYVFPLYLYPDTANEQGSLFTERTANLSSDFITAIRKKLGYIPTPEAIFYYTYAVFHSPTYRQRYGEFLKIDFPRLPLTGNDELFLSLGEKGEALVQLHLMQSKKLNSLITQYHGDGDHQVMEVRYQPLQGRIYINKQQYFEGIPPEVWEFKVGGYQVLDKWLKDRKKAKRSLSFDDILHYQRMVVALKETMQIMSEIDDVIPGWPLE
ncbi:MAG: type ISP restriction/modification enzyme, partial [Planktothrix sp.]